MEQNKHQQNIQRNECVFPDVVVLYIVVRSKGRLHETTPLFMFVDTDLQLWTDLLSVLKKIII